MMRLRLFLLSVLCSVSSVLAVPSPESHVWTAGAGGSTVLGYTTQLARGTFYVPNGSPNGTYTFYRVTTAGAWVQTLATITVTGGVSNHPTPETGVIVVAWHYATQDPYWSGHQGSYTDKVTVDHPGGTGDLLFSLTRSNTLHEYASSMDAEAATNAIEYLDFNVTHEGEAGPSMSDKLVISTKGNYYLASDAVLSVGLVESEAFNSVYSVAGMAIGGTVPTSLVHSTGELTEPSAGYFVGKNVEWSLVSGGTVLATGSAAIPLPEDHVSEVEIDFHDFGKQEPVVTPTPSPDPTNTGNQQLVTAPATTPAPSTTGGKTSVSATASTSTATTPATQTIVNNANTTLSGLTTGATNQDMYNNVLQALRDAAKGSAADDAPAVAAAVAGMTNGTATAADLSDRGHLDDVQGKIESIASGVDSARSGVGAAIAGLQADVLDIPHSFGSVSSLDFGSFEVSGATINLGIPLHTGFAVVFDWFRTALLWALTIGFIYITITTIRGYA